MPPISATPPGLVVAISIAKGGVGKSTLTYALGAEFARRGLRVTVLDCDDSRDAAQWVIDAALPGLDTATDTAGRPAAIDEESIVPLIREAREAADLVLIDLHGGMSTLMTYAIARADLVIVPARVSEHDVAAVLRTERAIRATEDAFDRAIRRRVVLTQLSTFHTQAEAKARGDLEAEGMALFRCALMRRTAFEKMSHTAKPLHAIDGADGNAQANLAAFAEEVLALVDPAHSALEAAE